MRENAKRAAPRLHQPWALGLNTLFGSANLSSPNSYPQKLTHIHIHTRARANAQPKRRVQKRTNFRLASSMRLSRPRVAFLCAHHTNTHTTLHTGAPGTWGTCATSHTNAMLFTCACYVTYVRARTQPFAKRLGTGWQEEKKCNHSTVYFHFILYIHTPTKYLYSESTACLCASVCV